MVCNVVFAINGIVTDLTQAVLKSPDDSPDCLMWFCKACTTALPGLKKLLVKVTAYEMEHSNIKQRVTELEEKEESMVTKSNEMEIRISTLEKHEQNKDDPQNIEVNLSDMVDNVLSERADQEKRKFKIICINLKKSEKLSPSG